MGEQAALSPIGRLTSKQRECLRLYAARYRVKEIAAALGGISENTVGSHLSEATRLLGAPGRAAAAAMLTAHEAAHPESRGRFSVGDAAPPPMLEPLSAQDPPRPSDGRWDRLLPLRLGKGDPNDLPPPVRLFWIVALAIVLAFAFGQLAIGARLLSDVFTSFSPAG